MEFLRQLNFRIVLKIVSSLLVVVTVGVAAWWLFKVPSAPPEASLPFVNSESSLEGSLVTSVDGSVSSSGAETKNSVPFVATVITVHVAGAVKEPGVYILRAGSRINDGVTAAGGATSVANLDAVNLATILHEGEQIYIPKRGEKPRTVVTSPQLQQPTSANGSATENSNIGAPSKMVNINLANLLELEELPGVGPATAKAIVSYREKYGAFLKVEDLLKVRGIGPAKLSEILPRASVG